MDIEREHPEYTARKAMWKTYRDLYAGGEQLKQAAGAYLIARIREPLDVYHERLGRVFYENYAGSIIDWYGATLFRREPILSLSEAEEPARRFFCEFIEDCDRKQTHLSDFMRHMLIDALLAGAGYALVDFPRTGGQPATRAEEDAAGVSRAYLVAYSADELINWSEDERGGYEWVVLRTTRLRQDGGSAVWQTRWQYYDRERFRIYVAGKDEPKLVDQGRHGFARLGQVPLFKLRVSEGLWLMNKAALLQLEHFNKSNALGWALTNGLFAMPVVYSGRKFEQMIGDCYWIQLDPQDRFGWTEPAGHVFQIAVENLARLKDEIYRVCYLMPQARDAGAPASGLSKQRDFTATQEVLRAYGDAVKDTLKRILRGVAAAREDRITIGVSGLDEFDIGDFGTELEDARRLLELGAASPTLRKEVLKKLAYKYLCDARQELKDQIAAEIEST